MAKASRDKGKAGEREAAAAFRAAGADVRQVQRNLRDAGDLLVTFTEERANTAGPGLKATDVLARLVVDVKRAERLKLPEWTAQVEAVARDGETPCVVYRSNREPWRVSLRLDDLVRLIGGE